MTALPIAAKFLIEEFVSGEEYSAETLGTPVSRRLSQEKSWPMATHFWHLTCMHFNRSADGLTSL